MHTVEIYYENNNNNNNNNNHNNNNNNINNLMVLNFHDHSSWYPMISTTLFEKCAQ